MYLATWSDRLCVAGGNVRGPAGVAGVRLFAVGTEVRPLRDIENPARFRLSVGREFWVAGWEGFGFLVWCNL